MLDQWIKTLSSDNIDLSATEIADVCWLALIQKQFGTQKNKRKAPASQPLTTTSSPQTTGTNQPSEPTAPPPRTPPRRPPPSKSGGLFVKDPLQPSTQESKSLRAPTAPALRDPLALARALRPLMQQRAIGTGTQLDESATVQKIAEERVWWPITKPQTEKWLELAIVVDESTSMLLWRRHIQEITRFFKHYGVFRDVRVWGLVAKTTDQPKNKPENTSDNKSDNKSRHKAPTHKIHIRSTPFSQFNTQDLRSPDSLLDPTGRRVILVLTDCVESLWQQPSMLSTLKLWSTHPMALLQMMPESLWPRTNLRQGTLVHFQAKTEGSINQNLEVIGATSAYHRRTQTEKQADIKVPVITLESDRIYQWTRMLATKGAHLAPGFIFNPRAQAMTAAIQQRRQQQQPAESPTAAFKTQMFRGASSPIARRLASLLAASPVITLPIVRIVQATRLPQSDQIHVAEVLLGGILKPQQPPTPDTNPDNVQYQFIDPQVRSELLAEAPAEDITAVLTQYIADNFNKSLHEFILELRRIMGSSDQATQDNIKPIATIAADVLQYRGREYADFVSEVKSRYEPSPSPQTPQFSSKDKNNLSLEDFPPITEFEFTELQLSEDGNINDPLDYIPPEFPPPLQSETVTVITLEAETPDKLDETLDSFEITVVTLVPEADNPNQWQRQDEKKITYRYIENLTSEISLEMVSIENGRFTMGSPDDEPERFNDESPQHDVTIDSFFMGRYPITQAQWRAVEAMPQIDRELDPDPSHFKGDNHPVEQVSWHDAIEFCARLSAHTRRQYRLPTEAEWEYACRAGTTTPFHFGNMITTEVANYIGSAYADGPEGEARQQTTPVDHFGIANAFGLSDMHGNVYEWCQDHWHENYEDAPVDGSPWLTDDEESGRLYRGGSWDDVPRVCRSACRNDLTPGGRYVIFGFRVVCSAPRILQ